MKQDLIFQMRAAMIDYPFGYYIGEPWEWTYDIYDFNYPTNYAYSGFYQTLDKMVINKPRVRLFFCRLKTTIFIGTLSSICLM